jgi:hypothetical protein
MREYLIRGPEGSSWIPVRQERLAEVFIPQGLDAAPCEGWGEVRFAVAGTEVSVSGEEPGWQVAFEGDVDPALADRVVDQMTHQLTEDSGQHATWIVITEQ